MNIKFLFDIALAEQLIDLLQKVKLYRSLVKTLKVGNVVICNCYYVAVLKINNQVQRS